MGPVVQDSCQEKGRQKYVGEKSLMPVREVPSVPAP